MTHVLALVAAGALASVVNTVVGSGSLISFPVLLALGYPPVVANITNSVGLVPGSVSGAVGYRHELAGQRDRIAGLAIASLVGGIAGACLLLTLPAKVFDVVVPFIIGVAILLVVCRDKVNALARWEGRSKRHQPQRRWPTWLVVCLTGIYGGYFSAAQGILLLAVLELGVRDSLQRLNAIKNVLQLIVNMVAATVFLLTADVAWSAAGLLALGGVLGGYAGAHFGRRLPAGALRILVVAVGIAAIVVLI